MSLVADHHPVGLDSGHSILRPVGHRLEGRPHSVALEALEVLLVDSVRCFRLFLFHLPDSRSSYATVSTCHGRVSTWYDTPRCTTFPSEWRYAARHGPSFRLPRRYVYPYLFTSLLRRITCEIHPSISAAFPSLKRWRSWCTTVPTELWFRRWPSSQFQRSSRWPGPPFRKPKQRINTPWTWRDASRQAEVTRSALILIGNLPPSERVVCICPLWLPLSSWPTRMCSVP